MNNGENKIVWVPDPTSLRDYFAGQALVGLLSAHQYARDPRGGAMLVLESVVNTSFRLADAMLKAREVPNE